MSRRLMILANLTALIAVTAIRAMPSQNRRSKIQRKNDYLQRTAQPMRQR
jgi:Tfp pilus assembly protein PilX